MERGWRRCTAAGAATVLVAFGLWMWFTPGSHRATLIVSHGVTVVVSALAAAACVGAALRSEARLRRGWLLIGAGMLSWSVGEAISAYLEVVAGREVAFPSLADVGYLGLVPLTLAGVAALVTVERNTLRAVLDGLIISGSLLYVSSATVLAPTADDETSLARLVALAHPIGDVATASVVFILLSRVGRQRRTPLVLVGLGLLALAVADSGFAYLVQTGRYATGNLVDTAWIAGFLLVALAALWATERTPEAPPPSARAVRMQLALPYVPLAVALLTSAAVHVVVGSVGTFLYANGIGVVLLVVVRQLVGLRDNQVLTRRLEATVAELHTRAEQLRQLAFHDPLTGLANRALFHDRVEHAISRLPRERLLLGVLYIDLDDLKPVNDNLGHAAGDAVLVAVAERLLRCVRCGDTVARLGGDEFAVLLEDVGTERDAVTLAARITDALATPLELAGRRVPVSASVGMAIAEAGSGHVGELLRNADIAMYGAKVQGKGRFVVFEPQMRSGIAGAPTF